MTDFTKMDIAEVAMFAEANQGDMDMSGVTTNEILEKINQGGAALEVRDYGFAVIQIKPAPDQKVIPHLWILYVSPDRRGAGSGARFMREILQRYSRDYHMSLYCYGARRRKFFGRFGFRIEERDGEMRRMTTNDCIR